MPQLLLMRHAKSSWDHPGLADFDRPLNGRGVRTAPQMGAWIATHEMFPDRVLCSTARRARETLGLAMAHWPADMRIDMLDAIFEADENELLALIRDTVSETAPSRLMVIGHNATMEDLALDLCGPASDSAAKDDMTEKYPTASLAIFACDSWEDLKPGGMRLERFMKPRDIDDRRRGA